MSWRERWQQLCSKSKQLPWSKYNLRRIEGIEPAEIDGFHAAELDDQESVQHKLDGYPGSVFRELEQGTHIASPRLLALLQESLKLWSTPSPWRRVKKHWADVALFAVISALAASFFYPSKKACRVVAVRAIPAFHQIQAEDLKEEPDPGQSGESIRQYTGKYTTSAVHPGNGLAQANLSPGLTHIRIEVKSSAVPGNTPGGQSVTLVFSSRTQPAGGTAIPAWLLKMETEGEAQIADLQVASVHEAEVAKWAGSSDALIIVRDP